MPVRDIDGKANAGTTVCQCVTLVVMIDNNICVNTST